LDVAIVCRRGYLADGRPAVDRAKPPLLSVMGNDCRGWCETTSGENAERVFAALAGKFKAAHPAGEEVRS
jgi:hypothetical protein